MLKELHPVNYNTFEYSISNILKPLSCWTQIYPDFANSVDPDQLLLKKPTDLDLHCLLLSMQICSNNLDQVIWLAENYK